MKILLEICGLELSRNGLLKFNGADWINFDTTNSNISPNPIRDIEFDKEGNVWFITGHRNIGLGKFDGNSFYLF